MTARIRIGIGVDYGTTASSGFMPTLTYAQQSNRVTEFAIDLSATMLYLDRISRARGSQGVDAEGIPSLIAYPKENERLSERCWGWEVESDLKAAAWTKLLLSENLDHDSFRDIEYEEIFSTPLMRLPEGKAARDVVKDYLRHLYLHILDKLRNKLGSTTLDICSLRFTLGVPAIWSNEARSLTEEIAMSAGFGPSGRKGDEIELITESEAVMFQFLRDPNRVEDGPVTLKPGDGVLICDCGGGTVDLALYEIRSNNEFAEIGRALGSLCGGTAIKREFYQWVSDTHGDTFKNIPIESKGVGSNFMTMFDKAMLLLDPSNKCDVVELNLPVSASHPNTQVNNETTLLVRITRQDVEKLHVPVVNRICDLLHRTIGEIRIKMGRDLINYIILSGGFSWSTYLRREIERVFHSNERGRICYMSDPVFAVAKGAAAWALRCPRHYGVASRDGINAHPQGKQVKWVLKKGHKYDNGHTVEIPLELEHCLGHVPFHRLSIFGCDSNIAPESHQHPGIKVPSMGHIAITFSVPETDEHRGLPFRIQGAVQIRVNGNKLEFRAFINGNGGGIESVEYF